MWLITSSCRYEVFPFHQSLHKCTLCIDYCQTLSNVLYLLINIRRVSWKEKIWVLWILIQRRYIMSEAALPWFALQAGFEYHSSKAQAPTRPCRMAICTETLMSRTWSNVAVWCEVEEWFSSLEASSDPLPVFSTNFPFISIVKH